MCHPQASSEFIYPCKIKQITYNNNPKINITYSFPVPLIFYFEETFHKHDKSDRHYH